MDLKGSRGTFWGALNAVLEFVDHHHKIEGPRISYALFGKGMDLKVKALVCFNKNWRRLPNVAGLFLFEIAPHILGANPP